MNLIDVGQVWDVINGLFVTIDSVIYKFVGWLYELYILISSARIFQTETFELFINRIYVILGVIMLFFLAYTILKNIADPDSFAKGESSMGKIISNTVISLVLIAILPTIFTFLYHAQEILLKENIIGRLILGNYSTASETLQLTFEEDVCNNLNTLKGDGKYTVTNGTCTISWEGKNTSSTVDLAGNAIAVDIFTAFYYPYLTEGENSEYEAMEDAARAQAEALGEDPESFVNSNQFYNADFHYDEWEDDHHSMNAKEDFLYSKIASYDACHNMADGYVYGPTASACAAEMLVNNKLNNLSNDMLPLNFKSVMQYAKTTGDFSGFKLLSNFVYEDRIQYSLIISTAAGLFVCYIFISYCIDMGLRAAKLGFAQLVAPVPILARIVPSQKKMFDSWTKFTLRSYFEVFVRIAIIFLGIFMITHLPNVQDMWADSIFANITFMSIKGPLIMDISSASWGTKSIARVAVIIGILMFVKQAPKLISDALGISINTGSLNIRNKLKDMVGGEHVVRGLNAVGALPGRGIGAIKGGLGSMWAANVHGNGKVPLKTAFAHGMKQGWKNPKKSFNKNFRETYGDITGDVKSKPSLINEGPTLASRVTNKIDKDYKKAVGKGYTAELEKDVANFEATDPRFTRAIEAKRSEYREKIREVQNSEQFKNIKQSERTRLEREFQDNEGSRIAKRMKDYEDSQEYRYARTMAYRRAETEVREEAARNGETLNAMEIQERARRKETDYLIDSLKQMNSENARQYMKDKDRRDNIAQELDRKANENAINSMRQSNVEYRKALENVNNTTAIRAEVTENVRREITANPTSAADSRYVRNLDELENKGKITRKKEFEDNWTDLWNKTYNEKNKK